VSAWLCLNLILGQGLFISTEVRSTQWRNLDASGWWRESSPLRSQAPSSRDDAPPRLSVRDFLSRWQISGQVAAIIAIKFAAPYEPADEQASDASIADRRAETQHEDAPAAAAAAVTTAPIR